MRSLFNVYILLGLLGMLPKAFAAKLPVQGVCEAKLVTANQSSFSEAARRAGVKFLLMKLYPKQFVQLIEALRPGDEVQIEPRRFLDKDTWFTFDHGLVPVFERDSGQWAHQLIRNGSDLIVEGVRYVLLDDLKIGFLFPVEVLDLFEFDLKYTQFTSRYGSGSATDFESKLRDMAQNSPYPDSYDVEIRPTLKGREGQTIPLSMARLIWIPAPLISGAKVPFPGKGNPLVPGKGEAFVTKISSRDPDSPRGWTYVKPPKDDGAQWLDAKKGLGTWFNVVPDWNLVDRALKGAGTHGIDLAHLASMIQITGAPKAIGPR